MGIVDREMNILLSSAREFFNFPGIRLELLGWVGEEAYFIRGKRTRVFEYCCARSFISIQGYQLSKVIIAR